jgi:glycosyltransferase involved in cell wall biosynthesis
MNPSIAVVIPAYNAGATIETGLRSVLAQTSPADEVIVVDDGSTDDTAGVVRRFSRDVRLIRQQNQGSAAARQAGTDAAAASYVAYLDADDWWPEDKLATCRKVLACEDVDFLLADLQRAWPSDAPAAWLPRNTSFFPWACKYFEGRKVAAVEHPLYRLEPDAALSLLLRGFPVYPSTALVKRDVVRDAGGWDRRFPRAQDFDIGLKIVRHHPLHFLDEVQAIIGLHSVNECAQAYVVKQTQGDIRVLHAHVESESRGSAYRRQVARALATKYCGLGYTLRKMGLRSEARTAYWNAMSWPGQRPHAFFRWALLTLY